MNSPFDKSKQSSIEFEGACHPTAQNDDYDGTFLTKKQMLEKIQSLPGTPVLSEHDNQKQIGKIIGARIDERNRLIVKGEINRDTFAGITAIRDLRNRKVSGLSLGIKHSMSSDPKSTRIIAKKIQEISLTENPDLPDTEIQHVSNDSEHWNVSKSYVRGSLKNAKLKNQTYKINNDIISLLDNIRYKIGMAESVTPNQSINAPDEQSSQLSVAGEQRHEIDELRRKCEQYAKENEFLKEYKATKKEQKKFLSGRAEKFNENPEKWIALMKEEEKKTEELKEKMKNEKEIILDWVTKEFTKRDKTIPEKLKYAILQGHNTPEAWEPLYEFLTVAHTNAKHSQNEQEVKYQTMKKKMEESDRQFQEINIKWEQEKKSQGYLSQMGQKRPFQESHYNEPAEKRQKIANSGELFENRWETSSHPPPNLSKIPASVGQIRSVPQGEGMQNTDIYGGLLEELFCTRTLGQGMDTITEDSSI